MTESKLKIAAVSIIAAAAMFLFAAMATGAQWQSTARAQTKDAIHDPFPNEAVQLKKREIRALESIEHSLKRLVREQKRCR